MYDNYIIFFYSKILKTSLDFRRYHIGLYHNINYKIAELADIALFFIKKLLIIKLT